MLSNTKCYDTAMKIGIVGAGASGVFLAIRLKESNPSFDVTLIERNDKILKKVLVTGNGRCNYANIGELKEKYNNELANKLLKEFTPNDIVKAFDNFGVHPTYIDNLVFPTSLSAQTVVLMMSKKIATLGIKVFTNEKVIDYQKKNAQFVVKTENKEFIFDKLVLSSGGKSYPQLGTDGTVIDILNKHGYKIKELSPTLAPIKVKENTKKISGQRVRSRVYLYQDHKAIYQEDGEVLFKDDGLSGIVILNISSRINRLNNLKNVQIILDLAPNYQEINKKQYDEYVSPKVAEYLLANNLDIHHLAFSFKAFYDYQIAEVSHGGLALEEVSDSLESKKEKGLYFTGELLDVDGMCGGYNLMFAFASAEKVKKALGE